MKSFKRKLVFWFYRPFVKRYLRKDRWWTFEGLKIKVRKGVFHPKFFYSTKILIEYLRKIELKDKTVLELGCGSGLVSVWLAKYMEAIVTSSDINPTAVSNAEENANINQVKIQTIESNSFEKIQESSFDLIVVNPPYFKGNPSSDAEKAWYAGDEFQYFSSFFQQVQARTDKEVILILSDQCELERINSIALEHSLQMNPIHSVSNSIETNTIYSVDKSFTNPE